MISFMNMSQASESSFKSLSGSGENIPRDPSMYLSGATARAAIHFDTPEDVSAVYSEIIEGTTYRRVFATHGLGRKNGEVVEVKLGGAKSIKEVGRHNGADIGLGLYGQRVKVDEIDKTFTLPVIMNTDIVRLNSEQAKEIIESGKKNSERLNPFGDFGPATMTRTQQERDVRDVEASKKYFEQSKKVNALNTMKILALSLNVQALMFSRAVMEFAILQRIQIMQKTANAQAAFKTRFSAANRQIFMNAGSSLVEQKY